MGKVKRIIRGLLVTMGISLMAMPAITSHWNLSSSGDVIQVSKKGGCRGGRGGCLAPDSKIYELSRTTLGPKGRFQPKTSDRFLG